MQLFFVDKFLSIGPVAFNHVFFYQDILSRRATTITHEEEKGSTFSKASFSTADSATEISIDDPDFWKKWAKKVGKRKGVTEGVVAIHPKLELSLRVKLGDQGCSLNQNARGKNIRLTTKAAIVTIFSMFSL